jgi:transposase
LVIEDVADGGEIVRVTARTRNVPVPCPVCGVVTGRVHGYHGRTVRDVPVDGREVVVPVRIRQLSVRSWAARGRPSGSRSPGSWSAIGAAPHV